jgi:type IV pilus assembly protein PilV
MIYRVRSQPGFSLIEVLVALLVLSMGLLGLAALQTTGLKLNHQSYERTQAVLQTYDIIDRMRTNRSGSNRAINATYENVALGNKPGNTDCLSVSCNVSQLAEFDIRQWNAANETLLPQGKGAICRGTFSNNLNSCAVDTSISIFRIAITWRENDLDMRLDVEAQP